MLKREDKGSICIIGGVLMLIAPFLPLLYIKWEVYGYTYECYYWMWGFGYETLSGNGENYKGAFFFIDIIGYICGTIVVISALIIISTGYNIRKGIVQGKKYPTKSGGKLILIMSFIATLSMSAWILILLLIRWAIIVLLTIFGAIVILSYGIYLFYIGSLISIVGGFTAISAPSARLIEEETN